MSSLAGDAQRLQVLGTVAFWHRVRYVDQSLWCLADRNGCDDLVGESVDRCERIRVLEPNINSGSIARWPDPMWQVANGDRRDLFEILGAKHLDLVQTADR